MSRKGGKFNERYNELTHTVVKIKKNGNCVIKSNKSGDILATPCPLKHLKKFFKWPFDGESDDSMEDRMATRPVQETDVRQPEKQFKLENTRAVDRLTASLTDSVSISTVTNENKVTKKLDFSDVEAPTCSPTVSTGDSTADNASHSEVCGRFPGYIYM